MTFPEKLCALCKRHNMTRGYLAHRIGVNDNVVFRWAHGSAFPGDKNLAALAQIFGMPEAVLRDNAADLPPTAPAARVLNHLGAMTPEQTHALAYAVAAQGHAALADDIVIFTAARRAAAINQPSL